MCSKISPSAEKSNSFSLNINFYNIRPSLIFRMKESWHGFNKPSLPNKKN